MDKEIDKIITKLEGCFGIFDYVLTPIESNLLVSYIKELQQENKKKNEVIDKVRKKLNNFIECCKAEKLESGSDYLHHQYWDMFERFNKQIKDILKEVSE